MNLKRRCVLGGILALTVCAALLLLTHKFLRGNNLTHGDKQRIAYDVSTKASKNIIFKTYANQGGYEIFLKKNILIGTEQTWADLYQTMETAFEQHSTSLKRDWRLEGQLLKAAFLLNAVAHFYALGEEEGPDGKYSPCSVRRYHNELATTRGLPKVPKIAPLQTYIESKRGECNDFAMVLYMMLKFAGFHCQHSGPSGHIYVEANIEGEAYVMDSFYNFFTKQTNAAFLNQDWNTRVEYHVFPMGGEDPKSDLFRKRLGTYRLHYMMTCGRLRILEPKDYSHWDHFDKWVELNGVHVNGLRPRKPG